MNIPKTVQRQLEQAEALERQIAANSANQGAPNVVTDASQLTDPPQPAAPAQPPEPPKPAEPQVDWQQKFRTMQGMYNAEVPALKTKVATYESELTTLKEQVKALTVAAQKPAETQKPAVDPKDIEAFGAELIDMVQRQASASHVELQNVLRQEFETRIRALEEVVNGVSKKAETSMEAQFYAALAQLVPNWKQINADERWLEWLAEEDPTFGVPRQAALDRAFGQGDAGRVAALFKQFEAKLPKPDSLANQVAPASTGAPEIPSQPAAPAPKLISQKFVQSFYLDQARGKFNGREAEAARIEAEINLAAAEGRIV